MLYPRLCWALTPQTAWPCQPTAIQIQNVACTDNWTRKKTKKQNTENAKITQYNQRDPSKHQNTCLKETWNKMDEKQPGRAFYDIWPANGSGLYLQLKPAQDSSGSCSSSNNSCSALTLLNGWQERNCPAETLYHQSPKGSSLEELRGLGLTLSNFRQQWAS